MCNEVLGSILQERHENMVRFFHDSPEIKERDELRAQVIPSQHRCMASACAAALTSNHLGFDILQVSGFEGSKKEHLEVIPAKMKGQSGVIAYACKWSFLTCPKLDRAVLTASFFCTIQEIVAGLKDYHAEIRAENAEHRASLVESEEGLHKLRLRLKLQLEANQEASAAFEREAGRLDNQILLRKTEEEKANLDMRQLEREISSQMRNIARMEREQRQLRQELRDI